MEEQNINEELNTEHKATTLLEDVIAITAPSSQDELKNMLSILTSQIMDGVVVWNKNLTQTIESAISLIDEKISKQISNIMHDSAFQKLEGSWTGLNKLVRNSELGPQLKIKLIEFTKKELLEQFEEAPAIDRSHFFNLIYQNEFGTAGGSPFSVLIGDFEFSYNDEDVALLRYIGEVSAAAHSPFISAASPTLFDYQSIESLQEGRPIASGFDTSPYASWNAFRESDDSRYVTLVLPRTLARLPYGKGLLSCSEFQYEEFSLDTDNQRRPTSNKDFTWFNTAYELALLVSHSFTQSGWPTAIRGIENGGKVENLPNYNYTNLSGEIVQQCPVEININDEREKELSDLGLLPLIHYKNTSFAIFMGGQTLQKPKEYIDPDATSNAAISARLPYILASARIAHYLKFLGRDMIGSFISAKEAEERLNSWISQYVNPDAASPLAKTITPLCEAKVTVIEQIGRPGCYAAVAYLRPWLQMEELSVSLRMVANIPG